MVKRMGITETRKEFNNLATSLGVDETISVTNRGKEVLAIMPWEAYEAITETLEILSDSESTDTLKKGIEDFRKNRTRDWEDVIGELDLV